ncbi:MAG: permease-like cell division protein FtsX [Candidatus Saccharimonadales bacterium]|nr:cell division transport system permease protein [Patescibacteria group bacterium]
MAKSKMTSKQFAQSKRKRRQWITFVRMCRYGVNNFSRNAWLTVAATAVMTITLLIVFATLAARNTLATTVDDIKDKVDMSIYLKTDVEKKDVDTITTSLRKLETVTGVSYVSPQDARAAFAEQNSKNSEALSALNEASNKFSGTVRVKLVDINDTDELASFVKNNKTVQQNIDPNREPSFAGERKSAIEGIAKSVVFADRVGIIATIIFVVISSLIVFNTIRMAIFNRKDEIEMMKLVGADKGFIRGPFIVEAVVYGFIAAVIATVLGVSGLYWLKDRLISGVQVEPTLNFVMTYIGFVLLGMIMLGALIGVVSSLLATRRYLKI